MKEKCGMFDEQLVSECLTKSFENDILLSSIVGEDLDFDSYFVDTIQTFPGDNPTLALFGNTWKSVNINSLPLDSVTILQLFAKIDSVSEIQAIGFSDGIEKLKAYISGSNESGDSSW